MYRHLPLLLVLLAALALAVAGIPRLHGMMPEAERVAMVLCADGGAKTVYLDLGDAPGNSSDNCKNCPICLENSMASLPPPGPSAAPRSARARRYKPIDGKPRRFRRGPSPQATGPPSATLIILLPERLPNGQNIAPRSVANLTFVNTGTATSCHRSGRNAKDARA